MVLKTEHAVVGIIIALLVGIGTSYIYVQNLSRDQISSLEGRNDVLQNTVNGLEIELADVTESLVQSNEDRDSVESNYNELQEDYVILNGSYIDLETQFIELESSLEKLENDYRGLLSTLSIIDAKNHSKTNNFELIAGQTKRYEYDVGYGIIWIVDISFDGSRFTCYINWRQGEQGGCVSGGCDTLEQVFPSIKGTVSTNVYDEGDVLFIRSNVNIPDIPRFCRDGSGRILKKTFDYDLPIDLPTGDYEFIINGGLEERIEGQSWMPVGWEGGGHIGGTQGYSGWCVSLYAASYPSDLKQNVFINRTQLTLIFWISTTPRTEPINLQIFFGDSLIYNETFTEFSGWAPVMLEISADEGTHLLKFVVPADKDYESEHCPFVSIDEVSLIG